MDRKERILKYMQSKDYMPLKFGELMMVLDVPKEDDAELFEILDTLCDEGKIYLTKKGRYVSVEGESRTITGILNCNAKGYFGFVKSDDENSDMPDVFIGGDKLGYAIDGDRVIVKIDSMGKDNKRPEGHIVKILERRNKILVGVIVKEKDGTYRIKPDNLQIYSKIRIAPENINNASIGNRVCVEITEYTSNGKIYGKVIDILGDKDSVKSCVEGIIIENGIRSEFHLSTTLEAEQIEDSVSQKDIKGRVDLRDELIFTIDGIDARDFDDAVSLKILPNGNYYLGVHIADVTHYVKEGSEIDKEAFERGTSVYLADRVIPMLPKRLSNGICSLNPKVDRLTLSVFMEIDALGNVVDHDIKETVIRSKEQMTYEDVNDIFDGDEKLTQKYGHLLSTLKIMEDLAGILYKKREKRGAIQFDFPETEIVVDKSGEPTDIYYLERGISHKMIEEFMLVANETVAEFAYWTHIPFVYRVHEAPTVEKITVFNEFISHFGLLIKGKFDKDNPVHPKALQKILDDVKGTPEEQMIASVMLRSLMKAEYRSKNLGHFGLAARYYCHYTSPIRRYADLAVHRVLKAYIHSQTKDVSKYSTFCDEAAQHTSLMETKAETAEREVEDLMKAAYMSDAVGDSFDAVIIAVTGFGMFVALDNSVEGLIRVENIMDDYYEYDETSRSLIGQRKKKVYQVGDRVKVTLMRSDIMLRQIDFVLKKDADKKMFKKFEAKQTFKLVKTKRSKSIKKKRRKHKK